MADLHTVSSRTGSHWQCLAGYRIRRILSADLFIDMAAAGSPRPYMGVPEHCRDRWADLAGALAVLPEPAEFYLVFACVPGDARSLPLFDNGVLSVGRGRTRASALRSCLRAADDLQKLFTAILDYAEFEPVTDAVGMARLAAPLDSPRVTEVSRRLENIHVGPGRMARAAVGGFGAKPHEQHKGTIASVELPHLFPWVPSDDSWWRLVDVMAKEAAPAALVVHARGWATAPADCRRSAHQEADGAERMIDLLGGDGVHKQIMQSRALTLRNEALVRLTAMEGPLIGARVFLASRRKPSSALLSVIESSLDDPSAGEGQPGGAFMFRGGARLTKRTAMAIQAPLDAPTLDQLFSPREATAILRTPMPTNSEYPGFPLNRARTAPMLGAGRGDDCPLGLNVHRGMRRQASMDEESRFRHCYIIGQTGTGKSTLMLHKIMHDIERGRGVAVLDPHGALIDDVLQRFPRKRSHDLMIVDMTDIEYPVGFNPLYIAETDPVAYRTRRDLVIDELFGYLDRAYDMKETGGPIFETHFRGMLGLLMGLETPTAPYIPSLLAFRMLYTNAKLRAHLAAGIHGKDAMLEEFVREATASGGEASLANIATYVTSKFNRFISDLSLRNITCQSRTIDFDDVVGSGKVLLFNLGKGRIGDYAAGLLASQFVSRIQQSTMARGRAGARQPFHLYADEFQLFASSRFAEMLAEGRKFGLSVTMAHQYAQQIPAEVLRAVIGNVGTTILFRIGAQDSEFFAPLYAPTFGQRDLVSLPNFRAYVRGTGPLGAGVFNVDVSPPGEDIDEEYAEALKKRIRGRLGRPRRAVEQEIANSMEAFRSLV